MKYILSALTLLTLSLWLAVFKLPDDNLHIVVCDVGQGDAILVIYKNIQILTDGGPDKKVIDCLDRYIPFWDRDIELIVSTHPDADHSTGLISVLRRYKVDNILINPIDSGTQTFKALEKEVGSRGVPIIQPMEGMKVGVGLIYLDIFNPNRDLISDLTEKILDSKLGFYTPKEPTNTYSITYSLSFGNFRGLFTGDFGLDVSDRLAEENKIGSVNYIKVPHHGSRNGMTDNLLKSLMPKVAVISVGKNNRYGHPTSEILEMLQKYNVRTYRTDEVGDVELVTNGEGFWMK